MTDDLHILDDLRVDNTETKFAGIDILYGSMSVDIRVLVTA